MAVLCRDRHPGPRPRRVPDHVGKRLLHDAVRRQIHRLRYPAPLHHLRHVRRHRQLGREPGAHRRLHQLLNPVQTWLRGQFAPAAVTAQHRQQPPHLREGLPGAGRDRRELRPYLVGHLADPVGSRVRLDGDHRHVVGDHVVEFAGDPGAFLQQRPLRPLGLADRLLLDEPALSLAPLPYGGADHQHHPAEDEQQKRATVTVGGRRQVEQQPGRSRQQPDPDHGPPALAQAEGQQYEEVSDHDRRGPRPDGVRPHPLPQQHQGAHDVGGEDDPPGLQRPVRQHQQGRRLSDGEGAGQPAGHSVVAGQHLDRDGDEDCREGEHDRVGQQPQPPVRRTGEQRGRRMGRVGQPVGQLAQIAACGAQQAVGGRGTGGRGRHGRVSVGARGAGRRHTRGPIAGPRPVPE